MAAVTGALVLSILLIDKERLFVYATEVMEKEGVSLCPATWHFDPLGGELKTITVALQKQPVAEVEVLRIRLWNVHAKHIVPKGMIHDWIPGKIDYVDIRPYRHLLSARGDFGRMEGFVDWRKKRLDLVLYPSPRMRRNYTTTLSNFRYDAHAKVYRYALVF